MVPVVLAILVFLILATNLPVDLTLRKICRVYVGVGGVGCDRVGDRVEIFGRYVLPRYREDIVRRDISRRRCSRIRCRSSRRECSHAGAGFAVVWHSQTTMPPESRDLPKWI